MIDIHCHLLPEVDDGCRDLGQTVRCIRQLQEAGFVGSICTPHLWPAMFPANTPAAVAEKVRQLRAALQQQGVQYPLWPGGELRLWPDAVQWMQQVGVPVLAGSRCVLVDFWEESWPAWIQQSLRWLLDQGYQPIIAHPERVLAVWREPSGLTDLLEMGVLVQGNLRTLTGEDGYEPDQMVRRLLDEGRYAMMATDCHQPADLESRLDGIALLRQEYGPAAVQRLLSDGPRRVVFEVME